MEHTDPLRRIPPTPFGESPFDDRVVVPFRPCIEPSIEPNPLTRLGRQIVDAFRALAAEIGRLFRTSWAGLVRGFQSLARALRVPRLGWRSPARTLRRMAGPVPRVVRIERRRRRAQLRRGTRRAA